MHGGMMTVGDGMSRTSGGWNSMQRPNLPIGAVPTGTNNGSLTPPVLPAHDNGSYFVASTNRPPPFDLVLCEPNFPKVKETDEIGLTEALLKRNQDLVPTPVEQTAIVNLMTKVKAVIEKLIIAPELFSAATVEEGREVGSFKKGTMITKSNIADLVVILRTLPTVEAVSALGNKIVEDIKSNEPNEVYGCVSKEFGCEIAGTQAVIRILITTLPQNAKLLEPDLHLNESIMLRNIGALRHARWFEENANHSTIKVLVRLLKDIRKRFVGFHIISVWAVELLAHYAVTNTPNRQPLSLNQAFRRVFQLLSAGIFLPSSPGLIDPCDPATRVHQSMTMEDMDLLCSTAQTLLRVISHGGYKQVLGLDNTVAVATEMSFWDGVVVTPLEKAYDANEMEPMYATTIADDDDDDDDDEVDDGDDTTMAAMSDDLH